MSDFYEDAKTYPQMQLLPDCNYCNYQIRLFGTLLNRYTSGGSKKLAAFEAVVSQICDWWKWQFFLTVTSLCCCCGNANNLKLWKGRIAKEFRDFATCDLDLHSNPAQILLKLWTDFVANCQKILPNCEKKLFVCWTCLLPRKISKILLKWGQLTRRLAQGHSSRGPYLCNTTTTWNNRKQAKILLLANDKS